MKNFSMGKAVLTSIGWILLCLGALASFVLFVMKVSNNTNIDWFSWSVTESVFAPVIYGFIIFIVLLINFLADAYKQWKVKRNSVEGRIDEMMRDMKKAHNKKD